MESSSNSSLCNSFINEGTYNEPIISPASELFPHTAKESLFSAIKSNNHDKCLEILEKIQERGVIFQDSEGNSALHLSASIGNLYISEILIENDLASQINALNKEQQTALHLACKQNHTQVIKLLLDKGSDISLQDIYGNSPLHYTAQNCNHEIFLDFINREGNIFAQNNNGHSPIDIGRTVGMDSLCLINPVNLPERPMTKSLEESVCSFISSYAYENFTECDIIKVIRKISYGEIIYLVKTKTDWHYAMKALKKSKLLSRKIFMKQTMTERNILSKVNHPFIVKLFTSYQSEDYLYLIYEYCPGGDFASYLKNEGPVPEDRARKYLSEIVLAIEALHERNIIYRNLKPKNVGLTMDGHVKLMNFTHAKEDVRDENSAYSFFMSITNLSPEILMSEGHGKPADWFMVGAFLYEILTGKSPFAVYKPTDHNMNKRLSFPANLREETKDFIVRILEKNPARRLGKRGIQEIKKHKFFEGLDWEQVYRKEIELPLPEPQDVLKMSMIEEIPSISSISSEGNYIPGWSFVASS